MPPQLRRLRSLPKLSPPLPSHLAQIPAEAPVRPGEVVYACELVSLVEDDMELVIEPREGVDEDRQRLAGRTRLSTSVARGTKTVVIVRIRSDVRVACGNITNGNIGAKR